MSRLDEILETINERRDVCSTHVFDFAEDPGGQHLRCVVCGKVELL
jgi:hypothetical protein